MYFYIFDPRGDKEIKYFDRIQGKLLNLIAENRIDGDSYRVTAIRSVELLVDQAIGANARTIIVVGSDSTLNKVVNALIRKAADVTLGFIPLDPDSALGRIFGMTPNIELAVKTIAGRLIRDVNLGATGEHFFLSQVDLGGNVLSHVDPGFMGLGGMREVLKLEPFILKMSLDDSYAVTSEVLIGQIINCRSNEGCQLKLGDPTDKYLDILFLGRLTSIQIFRYRRELASGCLDNVPGSTVMHAKKIEILSPRKLPLSIEGQVYTKAPAIITVSKAKIKMIVGKGRQF